jgi:retinoid hydroxylase
MTQKPNVTINPESSKLPLPPGSFGWPLIGETLEFFRDGQFAQKRFQKYGSVFKTNFLGQPTLFLKGAEACQFILTTENQYFQVQFPASTRILLGNSLSLQTGAVHQGRRKLLAQAFMPRALSGYIETMQNITEAYTQRWEKQATFTWYPELRQYTLDVACKLLVGLDNGAHTPLGELFEIWADGLFTIPINVPWTKFGRAKHARKGILNEIETIIKTRLNALNPGPDALGMLLQAEDEDGTRLSIEELKNQILTLLFAGHETLTSNITTFCLQMALHPEILDRLRNEQEQLQQQPITLENLKQMVYLEQVLKEVLRFTAPVAGVFRKVIQSCSYGGYQLPEGWTVLCQISSTHSSPEHYPEPEKFDPERFSPERLDKQSKYSYIPFGGGLRECLGKEFARLEIKLFAIHLIRHYQWDLLPNQNLELRTIPTPIPQDGLKVNFKPRT